MVAQSTGRSGFVPGRADGASPLSLPRLEPALSCTCPLPTAETLVDKAMQLEYFGGAYGNIRKPSPFLCLVLKMLQIQVRTQAVRSNSQKR